MSVTRLIFNVGRADEGNRYCRRSGCGERSGRANPFAPMKEVIVTWELKGATSQATGICLSCTKQLQKAKRTGSPATRTLRDFDPVTSKRKRAESGEPPPPLSFSFVRSEDGKLRASFVRLVTHFPISIVLMEIRFRIWGATFWLSDLYICYIERSHVVCVPPNVEPDFPCSFCIFLTYRR